MRAQRDGIHRSGPILLILDEFDCHVRLVSVNGRNLIICSVYRIELGHFSFIVSCRSMFIDLLDQIRDKFSCGKCLLTLVTFEVLDSVLRKGLENLRCEMLSLSHWLRSLNYERI